LIGCGKIKRDDTEKDPLSTTPNVIFDGVVSILGMSIGRWLVGGRKSIGNPPNPQFNSGGAVHSLHVGCSKIKRDDTEKDPLSTTPNVIFDGVVSILGLAIGRWLVGGRKSIGNPPNPQFDSGGAINSLSIGYGKIKRDDTEKDPLSTTPNVIFDGVVSILGMFVGRWLAWPDFMGLAKMELLS
jgi:hypothetical protein